MVAVVQNRQEGQRQHHDDGGDRGRDADPTPPALAGQILLAGPLGAEAIYHGRIP
jgi:hypothetical protein